MTFPKSNPFFFLSSIAVLPSFTHPLPSLIPEIIRKPQVSDGLRVEDKTEG